MSKRDIAVKLVVLAAITNAGKAIRTDLETEGAPEFAEGDRESAVLPDGAKVGAVTRTKPRVSAKVTDEDALFRWVVKHHPTELVHVVNDAYKRRLLDAAKKAGQPVDPATGEVGVPGITVTTGDPGWLVKPDPDALTTIADQVRRGQLGDVLASVLALPEGTEE